MITTSLANFPFSLINSKLITAVRVSQSPTFWHQGEDVQHSCSILLSCTSQHPQQAQTATPEAPWWAPWSSPCHCGHKTFLCWSSALLHTTRSPCPALPTTAPSCHGLGASLLLESFRAESWFPHSVENYLIYLTAKIMKVTYFITLLLAWNAVKHWFEQMLHRNPSLVCGVGAAELPGGLRFP